MTPKKWRIAPFWHRLSGVGPPKGERFVLAASPLIAIVLGLAVGLLALFVVSCGTDDGRDLPTPTTRSGPEIPLRWRCDDARPASQPRQAAQAAATPWERVARFLHEGEYHMALTWLDLLEDRAEETSQIRYFRAWATTLQAQETCSLIDGLRALALARDASDLEEGRELERQLRHLLGLTDTAATDRSSVVRRELDALRGRFVARPAERAEVVALVDGSPWSVRQVAEQEFLPQLSARLAAGGGGDQDRELAFVEALADELTDRDPMLRQSLDALMRTREAGPGPLSELSDALGDFAAGCVAYEEQRFAAAQPPLERAADVLETFSVPLAGWARFYLAIGAYYEDTEAGLAKFQEIARAAEHRGHSALAGRARWLEGSAHLLRNDPDRAVEAHLRARKFLTRAGGPEAAAFVEVLLAEAESMRGDQRAAWAHRFEAFATVPRYESLRRQIAMYWEAATALDREGRYELSGPLHEHALRLARQWGSPLGLSTALHSRARRHLETGEVDLAVEEIREATRWVEAMEPGPLRDEWQRLQDAYDGVITATRDPMRGETRIRAALDRLAASGKTLEVLALVPHHARVLSDLGKVQEAQSVLRSGLELFSDTYEAAESPETQADLMFRARRIGGDLVEDLFAGGEVQEALAVAESLKRHRYASLQAAPRGGAFVPSMDWLDGHWLSSFVVGDTVFWWFCEGARVQASAAVSRREVAHLVDRFRSLVRSGADAAEVDESLEQIYDLVARPLGLSAARRIRFLPDQETLFLPLAALRDAETGRHLIETTEISVLSGVRKRRADPGGGGAAKTLLVVAVSGGDTGRGLADLRGVVPEAQRVASVFDGSVSVLAGSSVDPAELRRRLEEGPSILHFAGHAVQNSALPDESYFSLGSRGEILDIAELRGLRLSRTRIAVLSSCTSLDAFGERHDAAFGLAGALVSAGVDSVLASTDEVPDVRPTAFLETFYRSISTQGMEQPLSAVFRATIVETLETGQIPVWDWASWHVLEAVDSS